MNQPQISNIKPHRAAKPAKIGVTELARRVRTAIADAEQDDRRPTRPMLTGGGFEPIYRKYERISDRFACFLACLTGTLRLDAPDAADAIFEFIRAVQRGENLAPDQPLLQPVSPGRLIVDEIDRCSTGHPLDQVVPKQPGFVDRELDREPSDSGMSQPQPDATVGQRSEGDIGISLEN